MAIDKKEFRPKYKRKKKKKKHNNIFFIILSILCIIVGFFLDSINKAAYMTLPDIDNKIFNNSELTSMLPADILLIKEIRERAIFGKALMIAGLVIVVIVVIIQITRKEKKKQNG